MRRILRFGAVFCSLSVFASTLGRPVLAQEPEAQADTASSDTTHVAHHDWRLPVGLAVFAVVLLTAPPIILPFARPDTANAGAWHDNISAHATAGVIGQSREEGNRWGWAHSESILFLKNRIHGELRIENLYLPDHFQFRTIRAGYLLRPKPSLAGGLTLGYRNASGRGVHDAFEIGLPLFLALSTKGAWRFEPTYLISSQGVEWHYRWLTELYFPRSPLVAGFVFEAKTRAQGGRYFGIVTLLFGVRS